MNKNTHTSTNDRTSSSPTTNTVPTSIHPLPQPQSEPLPPPLHAGPVVQIVNGEIVLQESSMVFHGSVMASGVGNPTNIYDNNNASMNGTNTDGGGGGGTNSGYDGNNHSNNNHQEYHHQHPMTVVEEEAEMAIVGATYTSFATGRRARPKVSHWSVEETQLFYEALQQVGMDFGTMEAYFEAAVMNKSTNNNNNIRFRHRRQLKRKYQAEYNKNPQLIEKALQCQGRAGIDLSVFQLSDDVVHGEAAIVDHNTDDDNHDNDRTTTIAATTNTSVESISEERNDGDTIRYSHLSTNDSINPNLVSTTELNNNSKITDTTIVPDKDPTDHDTSTPSPNHTTNNNGSTLPDATLPNSSSSTMASSNPSLTHNNTRTTGRTTTGTNVFPPKVVASHKKSKIIRPIRSTASSRMVQRSNPMKK